MDKFDRAQKADAKFLKQSLKAQAERSCKGTSRITCIDCGCVIPEARRKAAPGCERCVRCEQQNESLTRR